MQSYDMRYAMSAAYCVGDNEPGAPSGICVVTTVRICETFSAACPNEAPVKAGAETP